MGGGVVRSEGNLAVNIYVSANGSNENGDGSQERPYRTIEHIKSFVLPYLQTNASITIVPLTDIVEEQFTGFNQSRWVSFNNKDSGHTITFNKQINLMTGKYTFNNCIFADGVDLNEAAYIVSEDCTFKFSTSLNGCFRCRYSSTALLYNAVLQSDTSVQYAVACYDNAYIKIYNGITFSGDFNQLFYIVNQGSVFIASNVTLNTTASSGLKYVLSCASVLNLSNRGDGIFGEHLTAGTKDESSIIC